MLLPNLSTSHHSYRPPPKHSQTTHAAIGNNRHHDMSKHLPFHVHQLSLHALAYNPTLPSSYHEMMFIVRLTFRFIHHRRPPAILHLGHPFLSLLQPNRRNLHRLRKVPTEVRRINRYSRDRPRRAEFHHHPVHVVRRPGPRRLPALAHV